MPYRNFERDCAIFVAFEAGRTLEQLVEDYALKVDRVRDIIVAERHKRNVSPEPFYRSLRLAQPRLAARIEAGALRVMLKA